MRTEQKSRTRPGGNAPRWWLSLLLMTAAVFCSAPAASVAAAQVAEAETAEKEVAESSDGTSEADNSAGKQEEAPKESPNEKPESSPENPEAPAESEPAKEESTPKDETPAKEESSKEMKSDESEPPAESKEEAAEGTLPAAEKEPVPKEPAPKDPVPKEASPEKDPKATDKPPVEIKKKKCIIGATAILIEKQSELKFHARVDSGAKSCSLHVEKYKIQDESTKENIKERMTENIGKVIHFEIKNGDDKTHILSSKIAGYVIIKTSDKKEGKRRYKVPLTFLWKSKEKEVLVTLNDRKHMAYPLLLGRNFLRGDFLVDVEMDSDD